MMTEEEGKMEKEVVDTSQQKGGGEKDQSICHDADQTQRQ